ncbi:LPS translocon maturation chaperone LptM [Rheinheimera sp. 4Y26]|uniref:LPS translocon maturation chaperone LptM n=1 Tax=Rheinheimera sp. 4Y26 TaxID=2977811 RepID=UPI0021B0D535|nr:lipoprotein [Rheinheimera sp. 4Y26]MCT6698258.1 lipoprotein [Rheinheimera sp. 4Y26]
MKAVTQSMFCLLALCLLLTGCGQKGDLTLPKTKAASNTPQSQQQTSATAAESAQQEATQQPGQSQR